MLKLNVFEKIFAAFKSKFLKNLKKLKASSLFWALNSKLLFFSKHPCLNKMAFKQLTVLKRRFEVLMKLLEKQKYLSAQS